MIDPDRPVALAGVPSQTGHIVGTIINDYVYVRWDSGGGNNVHTARLIQTQETK
jgi:hypothetical protein